MIENEYLKSNNIQDLFEALTDSLLLNQPTDVIQHLQESLENVKAKGLEEFKYDNFHSSYSDIKDLNCIEGLFKYRTLSDKSSCKGDILNDFKVVLLIAAPGETNKIGSKLADLFNNIGYINMGECLRKRVQKESQKGICRWKVSKSLMHNGDFVPEDIALNVLLDEIKVLCSKQLIIIEGYPRNENQIKDLDNAIGIERILKVFMIDSFENDCRTALLNCYDHRSKDPEFDPYETSRKLANYKAYTLPVLKYFEDNQKLVIIEKDSNFTKMMKKIIDNVSTEVPEIIRKFKSGLISGEEFSHQLHMTKDKTNNGTIHFLHSISDVIINAAQLYNVNPSKNRDFHMSNIPLVLLQGGPKSGKTTIAKSICKMLPGWYHYDFSLIQPFDINPPSRKKCKIYCCQLLNALETISSFAAGIILENFPKSEIELNYFHEIVGKIDLQIFIDTSDFNISMRYLRCHNIKIKKGGAVLSNENASLVKAVIDFYKQVLLPTIRYFSDNDLSFNINGNQDSEKIATQCANVIRSIFYK